MLMLTTEQKRSYQKNGYLVLDQCFFEEDAFDEEGALNQDKSLSINKVGHAFTLHITCANTKYATENWLQAEPSLL